MRFGENESTGILAKINKSTASVAVLVAQTLTYDKIISAVTISRRTESKSRFFNKIEQN